MTPRTDKNQETSRADRKRTTPRTDRKQDNESKHPDGTIRREAKTVDKHVHQVSE